MCVAICECAGVSATLSGEESRLGNGELTVCCVCQDSPINKLLYARDIPRYKQMVERCVHQNQACVCVCV